jgi:hypothetical protein
MGNLDFIPHLLTHDGPFPGSYTISYVVMQLTAILMMRAAFWVNLTAQPRVD